MTTSSKIEIVLHVDEDLKSMEQQQLLNGLTDHDGVESAQFAEGRPHLVLVDYDADKIRAKDVLAYVQKEHVHAELTGA